MFFQTSNTFIFAFLKLTCHKVVSRSLVLQNEFTTLLSDQNNDFHKVKVDLYST